MSGEFSNPSDQSQAHSPINVLAFHKLSPHLSFGSTNFSPARFRRLLDCLSSRGYNSISLEDAINYPTAQHVAVCFDDGYAHLADHLPPVLEQYNIRPTVFLPTGYMGKPNSWDYSHIFRTEKHLNADEIRTLAEMGVRFGSHGHSHCDLTELSPNRLREELATSKKILEDVSYSEVTSISYPFGRHNEAVIQAAAQTGYKYGFTMSFPDTHGNLLALGRYPVYFYDTHRSIQRKLNRGRLYGFEKLRAEVTNRLSGGTILLNRIRQSGR